MNKFCAVWLNSAKSAAFPPGVLSTDNVSDDICRQTKVRKTKTVKMRKRRELASAGSMTCSPSIQVGSVLAHPIFCIHLAFAITRTRMWGAIAHNK